MKFSVSKNRYSSVRTKPVSVRLDSDLLDYVRSKNLNLSSTLNHLLRQYLYIHSVDDSIVFERLNVRVPAGVGIVVDVYSEISDL